MGLRKFDHVAAKTFADAVAKAGKYRASAAIVAGGTDILGALKDEIHPEIGRAHV